jgi:phosphonate transport system permease protein
MSSSSIQQEIFEAERRRRLYTGLTVMIALAILIAGYGQANSMNSGGFLTGLSKFFDYPGEIVIEAWEAGPAFLGLMIEFLPALVETLNIALTATLLGGLLAMVFAFVSTRNLDVPGWLVPIVRRMMDVMRAFPELIIALFLIFVLGTSPVPAMIAVAFHTVGALGKLFSEVTENVDLKPYEGLKACGATWLERIRFGVLPEVAPNFLSYFLLRLEINVRASAILGFVGAGGIGSELRRTIGWGMGAGDETAALFVLLFLSIVVIDQISSFLRARLTGGGAIAGAAR